MLLEAVKDSRDLFLITLGLEFSIYKDWCIVSIKIKIFHSDYFFQIGIRAPDLGGPTSTFLLYHLSYGTFRVAWSAPNCWFYHHPSPSKPLPLLKPSLSLELSVSPKLFLLLFPFT